MLYEEKTIKNGMTIIMKFTVISGTMYNSFVVTCKGILCFNDTLYII